MKVKATAKLTNKRNLFIELGEGIAPLADARKGKRTLRTQRRAPFPPYPHTNVRTLENWEQGRAKPNAQAALLINLVKAYPDAVQRLAAI